MAEEKGNEYGTETDIGEDFKRWTFDPDLDLERICQAAAKTVMRELEKSAWIRLSNYEIDGNTRVGNVHIQFLAWDGGAVFQRLLSAVLAEDVADSDEAEDVQALLTVLEAATVLCRERLKELSE